MSNWFSFHHISQQINTIKNRKHMGYYMMGSVLIVIMGIGLMLFVLKMSGIEPFKKNIANPKGGPTVFFHPSVNYWKRDISAWADEFELDPLLIATVM